MSELMVALGNLLVIAVTLGLLVTLKRKLGGRNFIAALLSTSGRINIGALFIGSGNSYG